MSAVVGLTTRQRLGEFNLGIAMLYVAMLCLSVPVLFFDILPNKIKTMVFGAGCILATFFFLSHRNFNLRYFGIGFGWFLFASVALVSRYVSGGTLSFSQCAFFLGSFAACLAACSTRWLTIMLRFVVVFLCAHLAATVLFFILPDVYTSTVKTAFFAGKTTAIGYQSGLTSHYSNNGFLLAFGSVLCASFFCGAEKKNRIYWLVLAALFFVGVVLTQKRSFLLLCLFSFICLFAVADVRGKFTKATGALIAVSIVFGLLVTYVPAVSDSFSRLVGTLDALESGDVSEATSGRTYLWETAIREWLQSPFFGNGWGSFYYVWPYGSVSIYAHNEILQLLHDFGIIGLSVFVALVIPTVSLSIKNLRWFQKHPCDSVFKSAAFFALTFQVFLISYACTSGILFQSALVCVPWMLTIAIGLALRYERRAVINRRSVTYGIHYLMLRGANNESAQSWRFSWIHQYNR